MLSRIGEARQYAEALYRDYPDREDALQAYIKTLVASGDAAAPALIEESLPNARSAMRSFLYCEQSKLRAGEAEMLEDLHKSLIANPRNLDTLFELYQFYYGRSDYRKASYYLKQIVVLSPNDEYMRALNGQLDRLISS
jgi:tetratricopeptide (TPR) repeat protein